MKEGILDLLLNKKIISHQDIQEIKDGLEETATNLEILDVLIKVRKVSSEDIADVTAEYYGLERIDCLDSIRPAADIPVDVIKKHRVFPVKIENNTLYLAMEDPADVETTDLVSRLTEKSIVPLVCTSKDIDRALQKWYNMEIEVKEEIETDPVEILNSPAVRIVRDIIEAAVNENASDVHIEPYKNKTVVRFRSDGILKKYTEISRDMHILVVSRIKIMAGLDITERRVSQDGQMYIYQPQEADIRVSILPTVHGEKVVMRVLDRTKSIPSLDSLGYDQKLVQKIRKAINSPYGMILVTGPTGSGKTTTLYSVLSEIISDEINITTIEDPPEHDIPGVNHVAVSPRMRFADALRAILRQDPNVIMVGEIRDSETAKIAVQAALTGHLVLTTLHTNSAAAAPIRLIDMGAEPYLVASSLLCVVAQRLVRKICPRCITEDIDIEKSPMQEFFQVKKAMKGSGCRYCDYTGYSGRRAVSEIMPVTRTLRELIKDNASADEIQSAAIREGVVLLKDNVRQGIMQGQITLEDAVKTVYSEDF